MKVHRFKAAVNCAAFTCDSTKYVQDCELPPPDGWYRRVWYYTNLAPEKIPMAELKMTEYLKEHVEEFREKFRFSLDHLKGNMENAFSGIPVVCGEGDV